VAKFEELNAGLANSKRVLSEVRDGKEFLIGVKDPDKIFRRIQTAQATLETFPTVGKPNSTSSTSSSLSCSSASYTSSSSASGSSIKNPQPLRELQNLIIMKTHGGVTEEHIYQVSMLQNFFICQLLTDKIS
jgi:hypothetical protein